MVGDPGIEPGVRLREGVTVPCHTLRPVAHFLFVYFTSRFGATMRTMKAVSFDT